MIAAKAFFATLESRPIPLGVEATSQIRRFTARPATAVCTGN